MTSNTGSIADFHPADINYNPAIRRHRGRPAAYRHSPLSSLLDPEASRAPETPATDRSNRPRLTIQTLDFSNPPEPAGDEADTPHPSQDDDFSSTDEVLDSYYDSPSPSPPATANKFESDCPVSPTDGNDCSTGDDPLSPVSPIDGPSTVGPHVRFADDPHPKTLLTPLQQQRETLRNLLRNFDRHILEPGVGEPQWMRFRGALQPAVHTLATDQIIHALKQHLPSVQETLSQNAQLRGALAETQGRQDANEVELERLQEENRGLRGALDQLQVAGEESEHIKDLTLESEQTKIELEKTQKELQESFDEREIDEGNFRFEITAAEEALATLQREHDAVLADRQVLRTQAQQTTHSLQLAQQELRDAGQEALALRGHLQKAQTTSTATTNQITMLERQVIDSHDVVLNLREQIFNLESRQAKEKQREKSSDTETTEAKRTDLSHSPDSPEPSTPPATEPTHFPFPPTEDTTAPPSPALSPLEQARRDLLADRRNIASIIDPLAASAYSTRRLSRPAIHHTTASGLAGSQILQAIRDHLPDVRERQSIKAAYRCLQLRSADDEKLIDQLRGTAANNQRGIDIWKTRVQILEGKQREQEEEEQVVQLTPATVDVGTSTTTEEIVDMEAYTAIRDDLRETRTQLAALKRQHDALVLAAADDDEARTAQLQSAQHDVARLQDEATTLHQALDAATTTGHQHTDRIRSLDAQLHFAQLDVARLQDDSATLRHALDGAAATAAAAAATTEIRHTDRIQFLEWQLAQQRAEIESLHARRLADADANTTAGAVSGRIGNAEKEGVGPVDFMAFWTVLLAGVLFAWWVAGGEVSLSSVLGLVGLSVCAVVGTVGVGVWRGEFVVVHA